MQREGGRIRARPHGDMFLKGERGGVMETMRVLTTRARWETPAEPRRKRSRGGPSTARGVAATRGPSDSPKPANAEAAVRRCNTLQEGRPQLLPRLPEHSELAAMRAGMAGPRCAARAGTQGAHARPRLRAVRGQVPSSGHASPKPLARAGSKLRNASSKLAALRGSPTEGRRSCARRASSPPTY